MSIDTRPFCISGAERIRLADRPTRLEPVYGSKRDYVRRLRKRAKALDRLQRAHAAAERCALLLILQGMDGCGKDGAVRHVMAGVNPQGCQVHSFKPPSAEELRHDFLWRATAHLPARGRIGIFNRSYYEEVLVTRVHPELLGSEGVADGAEDEALWERRFRSIRDYEAHLDRNGVKIVKVFLHLSKEEQRRRFLSRIQHPEKNWKFDPADMVERAHWDRFTTAYEACVAGTSTQDAPWYVVPADDKKTARLIISQLMLDALRSLHPTFPEPTRERREDLARIREQLEQEDERVGGAPALP